MRWCRTDPVQNVSALILTGPQAADRLAAALARRPAVFRALPVAHGEDWAAIFATSPDADGDAVLPALPDATPLFEALTGWWFPVGLRLDVPVHLHDPLLNGFAQARGFAPPVIIMPRMAEGDAADVYPVRAPAPLARAA